MAEVPPPPPNPYKILSKTYQSSLRWTPGYMDRITLDDPRYNQYQDKVRATVKPKNAVVPGSREVKRMGDKFFYMHRDIPVEQKYNRTMLKRSEVRPWDELVDRPLMSQRVRNKEVQLPYPQEHPHSSHIPHYMTFPDPCPHPPNPTTNIPITPAMPQRPRSAGIALQATPPPLIKAASPDTNGRKLEGDAGERKEEEKDEEIAREASQPEGSRAFDPLIDNRYPCNPPRKNYITRKAYDYGVRVEVLDLKDTGSTPEMEHLLWQMPKGSTAHKRCITYPAPSHHFSRQSTAPNYLQLPLPSSSPSPGSATPSTYYSHPYMINNGMADFHNLMCRTTSYTDHYPAHSVPSSRGGIDRTLRSVSSFRPFTSEQRGKYHFNTGSGLVTPRPGMMATPYQQQQQQQQQQQPPAMPELTSDREIKRQKSNESRETLSSNGGDEPVILVEDEEGAEVENLKNGLGNSASMTKMSGSLVKKGAERRDVEVSRSIPLPSPHLSGEIVKKPQPKSGASKVSPASRVLSKQHKFPSIEDKPTHLLPVATTSQLFTTDPAQKMAFVNLGPSSSRRSVGEMVTPPCIRIKQNHAHSSSLPVPRLMSRSMAEMQPRGVERYPTNGQMVNQFTRNLQRQIYSSPDMRGVTMKEGKKHSFFGHHGYDYH